MATVAISATSGVEVVPGGTQLLTAVAKDAKGNSLTDRAVTWSTSDPAKVTVVAGLVTGVALGSATITASSEGHDGTVEVKVKDGAIISAAGTTFSSQGGAVNITVPAGAVTQTTSFTVAPAANPPANARLLPGTAFEFGPPGLTFAQGVTVSIKYNAANVAPDSPEEGLQLYELIGGSWRVVTSPSLVSLSAKTVTATITHVGTYSVMMLPKVETVTISGDQPAIPVITTRQLTATVKDNEGTTLNRPVQWNSSNPAVLSVDATTGLATAKVPGSVTVTATSEGKSGTATVTVIAGPASKLVVNAGNNQSVAAGAAVPIAPSVKVTDAGDNPIAGVAVVFALASGGGTITGANATTERLRHSDTRQLDTRGECRTEHTHCDIALDLRRITHVPGCGGCRAPGKPCGILGQRSNRNSGRQHRKSAKGQSH